MYKRARPALRLVILSVYLAHLTACLDCRLQSGGASMGWVMTGDDVPSRAWQSAARSCFGACRAVRFIHHNNRRRVCASGYAKRYDSSGTTTGGAFVPRVMPGGTIHPAQQPAARLCFGACQAVRFIQHNNRRRVRDSGHARRYDSISTTRGRAFVLRGMPDGTIHRHNNRRRDGSH